MSIKHRRDMNWEEEFFRLDRSMRVLCHGISVYGKGSVIAVQKELKRLMKETQVDNPHMLDAIEIALDYTAKDWKSMEHALRK